MLFGIALKWSRNFVRLTDNRTKRFLNRRLPVIHVVFHLDLCIRVGWDNDLQRRLNHVQVFGRTSGLLVSNIREAYFCGQVADHKNSDDDDDDDKSCCTTTGTNIEWLRVSE